MTKTEEEPAKRPKLGEVHFPSLPVCLFSRYHEQILLIFCVISDSISDRGAVSEHDPSKDNRTIFVSNLDYSTDSAKIREVFVSVGTITDLRLVKDFKGRSKGYCYIVFSSFVSFYLKLF